jgi:hypothetical protein
LIVAKSARRLREKHSAKIPQGGFPEEAEAMPEASERLLAKINNKVIEHKKKERHPSKLFWNECLSIFIYWVLSQPLLFDIIFYCSITSITRLPAEFHQRLLLRRRVEYKRLFHK